MIPWLRKYLKVYVSTPNCINTSWKTGPVGRRGGSVGKDKGEGSCPERRSSDESSTLRSRRGATTLQIRIKLEIFETSQLPHVINFFPSVSPQWPPRNLCYILILGHNKIGIHPTPYPTTLGKKWDLRKRANNVEKKRKQTEFLRSVRRRKEAQGAGL